MKLTVIGGGGVRSMFLAKSIAQRAEELHIDELVFMDNDPEKLRIYGGLAAHVARMLCPTMKFTLTSSAEEAVTDADYVITTIRVGGDAIRVRDERLALDLGILGQETTGAAGVSFAMRSIPALNCWLAGQQPRMPISPHATARLWRRPPKPWPTLRSAPKIAWLPETIRASPRCTTPTRCATASPPASPSASR